jgi:hypothetical protein
VRIDVKLADLTETLDLAVLGTAGLLSNEVTGGYASDLLSDVIANGRVGNVWITLQVHINIVAVASLKELAGIILINGRQPDADTVQKAEAESIPIMVSPLPAFELVGRLYELGIRGESNENAANT